MIVPDPMPRYAIAEIERRWLVDPAALLDLTQTPYRLYEDLYLNESRLRLRKITEPGGKVLYKLGKKYGKRSTLSEPITTLYLNETEYMQLRNLQGSSSSKHRYSFAGGSLDIYERPIVGFMIFEREFESERAAVEFQPPAFVTREVTGEPEYSGFQLARFADLGEQ